MATVKEKMHFPSSLEVKTSDDFGRGLYAKSRISLGTEVMRSEPFVYVLSNSERRNYCDYCLRPSDSLLKCGQCKFVWYCGKECQKKDWNLHKRECKGIARIQPNIPSDTMRLITRILHKKEEQTDCGWEMDLLCSHRDSLGEEVKGQLAEQLFGVQKLLGESSVDARIAYDIACKLLCNTFTVYDDELNAIGAGIYTKLSLLNHSCDPNCIQVNKGPTFCLRTIKNIEPGEQLFISYVELLDTKEHRQTHLKKVYSFDCNCLRCGVELQEDSVYKMMYGVKSVEVSTTERDGAMKEGFGKLDDIETLRKKKDWKGMVKSCRQSLCDQSSVLHSMNIVTVKTLESLLHGCIELKKWEKALETAEKLEEPYGMFLPGCHPVSAVHLLKLGKLRRLCGSTEQLELSVRDLTRAVDLLAVAYGHHHPTMQQAVEMLQDSQKELVHRKMTLN